MRQKSCLGCNRKYFPFSINIQPQQYPSAFPFLSSGEVMERKVSIRNICWVLFVGHALCILRRRQRGWLLAVILLNEKVAREEPLTTEARRSFAFALFFLLDLLELANNSTEDFGQSFRIIYSYQHVSTSVSIFWW